MTQSEPNRNTESRGIYFSKKQYNDEPVFSFSEIRSSLPEPFCEKNPEEENCYWKAWEIAYKNVYKPTEESGFVSNFVDAAFNQDIFMWDTAFITMFCNIAHPYIPGIRSLDNFYCKQFDDGEIPREIVRHSGQDFSRWVNHEKRPLYSYFHNHYQHRGLFGSEAPLYEEMYSPKLGRKVEKAPYLTLDNLNHPIMAWAEMESYRHTGDIERLELVWEPLLKYYEGMHEHLQNQFGLFVTDWASMDNSPRNQFLGSGIDISCEMVLFARNLVEMGNILLNNYQSEGKEEIVKSYAGRIDKLKADAEKFTHAINKMMWDADSGFYYDVTDDGDRTTIKTIAAFWALLSEVADREQAEQLVGWLNDPATFARVHRVPTLAADEEGYNPKGGYWRGGVWAPTNTMVIRGLEKYGYDELAKEIALNHLENVVQVYQDTGTIWENYAPDSIEAGDANNEDFVGWSGIAPILYFLEYRIGLSGDASKDELTWKIDPTLGEIGCNHYWFAGRTIHLRAAPKPNGSVEINVNSDRPLTLHVQIGEKQKTLDVVGKVQMIL